MFKKKQTQGNYFVYSVFDTVSKKWFFTFYHSSDEDMIRTSLPTILAQFPLRDIEVWKVGSFDDTSGELFPCKHVLIPTSCYLFPHSRLSSVGDDISPEEIDSAIKEEKNKILSSKGNMEVVNE